jgi:hypothetical protein
MFSNFWKKLPRVVYYRKIVEIFFQREKNRRKKECSLNLCTSITRKIND